MYQNDSEQSILFYCLFICKMLKNIIKTLVCGASCYILFAKYLTFVQTFIYIHNNKTYDNFCRYWSPVAQ